MNEAFKEWREKEFSGFESEQEVFTALKAFKASRKAVLDEVREKLEKCYYPWRDEGGDIQYACMVIRRSAIEKALDKLEAGSPKP